MGLGKDQARLLIGNLKQGTANRTDFRGELVDALNLLQKKLTAFDTQSALAAQGFAESKPSQFASYLATLPADVGEEPPA